MANGTLANLARAGFVRTPRDLADRIVHHLLRWPTSSTVLDPTVGEGDLLWPTLRIQGVRRFGIEISADRADIARQELPGVSQIITSAVEAVHIPKRSMSAILANPPYFFVNGKRAEYIILSRAGEALLPGGIMVAILPARSAWDAAMIKHCLSWYSNVRVWKTPDRLTVEASEETIETAFEDYTQIVVCGVRRADPVEVDSAEYKRLQAYRWRSPRGKEETGRWEGEVPPLDLPTEPIVDPYMVPFCKFVPELVVRRADDAVLLEALGASGAHRSAAWDDATIWQEEVQPDFPSMPCTGPAHLAAAILNDVIGGQVITERIDGTLNSRLFTAFISSNWRSLTVSAEEREKMRGEGVIHAVGRQWEDLPVLGVMDLPSGESRYYESNEALAYLQPWLAPLADRVARLRPPLYALDPEDWELRVLTQFALDKRLPGAEYPGLAPAQMHRVLAMGRSLDVNGRTAIQGEPGTGKTRMGTASAARQAYMWRHRQHEFAAHRQPAWVGNLRRAWLKNPRTLAILNIEPVYGYRLAQTQKREPVVQEDASSRHIVAYRELRSGKLILPEDAGPHALPVLVATPKKVTKEYANEIKAAWPQAEIFGINSYQDIPRWLQRCAESTAPAVVGIFSHSVTRAYGCDWHPATTERVRVRHRPDLNPPNQRDLLEVRDHNGHLQGYCDPNTDQMILLEQREQCFLCPDCGKPIEAVPGGNLTKEDPASNLADQFKKDSMAAKDREEEESSEKKVVTHRIYFERKHRWCKCPSQRRNSERIKHGRKPLQTALWTRSWRVDLREKYPVLTFAEWSGAMDRLRTQAKQEVSLATPQSLVQMLSVRPDVQERLIDAALGDEDAKRALEAFAQTYTPQAFQRDLETPEGLRRTLIALAKSHLMVRERLVANAAHLLEWWPIFFQAAMQRWQEGAPTLNGKGRNKGSSTWQGVRLRSLPGGKADGPVQEAYGFSGPVPDSFSPYDYLYRFFRGCVALSIVDESHNGKATSSDIAHSHHLAMLAAQTHELTSGTHYGGDILSFYHYWFRFHPQFWKGLGLGWNDAAKGLKLFGVVQEWTKEYESDARKGSGQTDVRVSTIAAPGLSSKLIPRLLQLLVYLTVLDVGAFMPPRVEIPELVNMEDLAVCAAQDDAHHIIRTVHAEQEALHKERQRLVDMLVEDESVRAELNAFNAHAQEAEARHAHDLERAEEKVAWAEARDLAGAYASVFRILEDLSQKRNQTARMGKGSILPLFAALPCESAFTLEQTMRGTWGNELGKVLLLKTPVLAWEHEYPAEQRLREIVTSELAEGRRVMIYIAQNDIRSMPKRLAWVLRDFPTWTLPNSVKSEDRQQAILDAVNVHGKRVLLVPYKKVNEGLNLQSAIDTIIWYEMAMNLFFLDQASRRAWRLGKQEEVRIYYLVYAGTAAHSKLRKLGSQSGAAAAFAGEPARGALIEHAGADKTTLARLSAILDEQQETDEEDLFTSLSYSDTEAQALKEVFARRAEEENAALKAGRQWLGGVVDRLPERLPAFFAGEQHSVWRNLPPRRFVLSAEEVFQSLAKIVDVDQVPQKPGLTLVPVKPNPPVVLSTPATIEVKKEIVSPPATQVLAKKEIVSPPATQVLAKKEIKAAKVARTAEKQEKRASQPVLQATPAAATSIEKLLFGNADHIALVRPKRPRKARPAGLKHPRRPSPVEVRTIAALDESAASAAAQPQAIMLSLWSVMENEEDNLTEHATVAQPKEEVIGQQSFW